MSRTIAARGAMTSGWDDVSSTVGRRAFEIGDTNVRPRQAAEKLELFYRSIFVCPPFFLTGARLSGSNVQDMHIAIHRICGKHRGGRAAPSPQTLAGRGFPGCGAFALLARPVTG